MRFAVLVTPAPDTEIATTVCLSTGLVKILKPPVVEPRGIITPFGTEATAGLLLVTCSIWSDVGAVATVTVANEPPPRPTVEVGSSDIDAGAI